MRGFVLASSDEFTDALNRTSPGTAPVKDREGKVAGKFCFEAEESQILAPEVEAQSLTTWEGLVENLQKFKTFQEEPFFWTVLGLSSRSSSDSTVEKFREWRGDLEPTASQAIDIYHYRPQASGDPTGFLLVDAEGPIEKTSSATIEIDSRYDLKQWHFTTESRDTKNQFGYFRIRSNDEWGLELPATLEKAPFKTLIAAFIAGSFMALPLITSYANAHLNELSISTGGEIHGGFWITTLLSLLSGWIAAAVVLTSLPRVRP